jgi:hypothetical protein
VNRRFVSTALAVTALFAMAPEADALYLFHLRKDLDLAIREKPDDIVGKQVVFTDELIVVWPSAVATRPESLDGNQHVLFDTAYFHCAIPQNAVETYLNECWADAQKGYGEAGKKLEEINDALLARSMSESEAQTQRRELYWELYRVWRNKPLVTVFGTVARADFWGPVKGKDNGVATEAITIVADKVERPRERWYESLDEN